MQPEILLPVTDPALKAALDQLAKRHKAAGGVGMQVMSFVGGSAENLMSKLPTPVRDGLEGATSRALETAFNAAARTRGAVPDRPDWVNTALTTAMGAAGSIVVRPNNCWPSPISPALDRSSSRRSPVSYFAT